jgi:Uma2 family endonuclease
MEFPGKGRSTMVAEPKRRPFTVEEYYRLAQVGILRDGDRVELIEGEIIQMTPIGIKHSACVIRLIRLFSELFSKFAVINAQNAIQLNDRNEPEPDLSLLRLNEDLYYYHKPRPEDIYLIVEVSDSSLIYDRKEKLPVYAWANIPEVWIVNLIESGLEVYREPTQGKYGNLQKFRREETIFVQAFPEISIPVKKIIY